MCTGPIGWKLPIVNGRGTGPSCATDVNVAITSEYELPVTTPLSLPVIATWPQGWAPPGPVGKPTSIVNGVLLKAWLTSGSRGAALRLPRPITPGMRNEPVLPLNVTGPPPPTRPAVA